MSYKNQSIISEIFVILIGLAFIVYSLMDYDTSVAVYRNDKLYPIAISGALIVAALAAMARDVWGKDKHRTEKKKVGNMKAFFLVAGMSIIMKLIWQYLHLFYVAIFLGVVVLLYSFHDTQKTRKKRLIFALIAGAVFTAGAYLVFSVLLTIKF